MVRSLDGSGDGADADPGPAGDLPLTTTSSGLASGYAVSVTKAEMIRAALLAELARHAQAIEADAGINTISVTVHLNEAGIPRRTMSEIKSAKDLR